MTTPPSAVVGNGEQRRHVLRPSAAGGAPPVADGDVLRILAAPHGRVLSVALGSDGADRTLIISGGADGTVRRWDAVTGAPVGDPLTGHTGLVWSVALGSDGADRTLIISGGADGTVVALPAVAGGPAPVPRTDALAMTDDVMTVDRLRRRVLAAYLAKVLVQLLEDARSATSVVHVDGRWGSGKSTFVELLLRHDGPSGDALDDPVVIRYDAWRESAVAPEWWSVASSVNLAIRRHRAWSARIAMTTVGVLQRLGQSPAVLVAGAALAATVAARALGLLADAETLGTTLTTLTAVVAVALAAGRILFWSSPLFGTFHLRADDNPLGGISALVSRLRRWSPRNERRQRIADALLGVWLAVLTAVLVAVLLAEAGARRAGARPFLWLADNLVATVAAVGVASLVAGRWAFDRQEASGPPTAAGQDRPEKAERPTARWDQHHARRVLPFLTAAGALAAAFLSVSLGAPRLGRSLVTEHLLAWWVGLALLGVGAHVIALRGLLPLPRRPAVLVIDDLDRCTAARVTKLIETVHTLLRERAEPSWMTRWRAPCPLLVIVLADGRWLRRAFETTFEEFVPLGSPVHPLGADFLHKVFDHVVLVSALSANQLQSYTDQVTTAAPQRRAVAPAPAAEQRPAGAPPVRNPEEVEREIEATPAGQLASAALGADIRSQPEADRVRLASARAAKSATPEAVAEIGRHLLSNYADLMPANPRLIKRVANTFGMLLVVKGVVGHAESLDTVTLAAIFFVRFPALVDELLSSPVRPDPATGGDSPWRRPDVTAVCGRVTVEQLARCYGREFPPPVPATIVLPGASLGPA